ncbi:MAG: nicotinamide riboside transporter PnuC [Lachnospiraceae bacterium]|nr:nicotinamide riboside transporter PnuC [Lachnospiraceae bacterium]
MKKKYFNLTKTDITLWGISAALIIVSFFIFGKDGYLTLTASLIGITSLIFNAKGNPIGPLLSVVFSVMYGIISYTFSYYGEMATYLGMTAPMSVFSLISWLKNPFDGSCAEVKVKRISKRECVFMVLLTAAVTVSFYFVLSALNTANLVPSVISVATSFLAVYLTFRRSPYFAAAYAANDIVLIIMWAMAATTDISYVSVIICFVTFLANDIYGLVSWLKMQQRQEKSVSCKKSTVAV